MTGRRGWLSGTLATVLDWPGALERQELYSSLIVGAKSRATQEALLVASFGDPSITPRAWQALKLDAVRCRAARP